MLSTIKNIFFIGIGGSGMSGIAKLLVEMGYHVSGSDLKRSDTVLKLEQLGATCYIGHSAANLQGAQLVVVSTAVPQNNVELTAARERGIPVVHRGEMLASLMQLRRGIAVSGTHGKTTTTSMTAKVLETAGLDPTVIIGGMVSEFTGNARLGHGDYLVAEADESDGSFLKLEPQIVIVTNIEADHLDHYGCQENIDKAFTAFLHKVSSDGLAIICLDSPGINRVMQNYAGPRLTYSVEPTTGADLYYQELDFYQDGSRGLVCFRGQQLGEIKLQVPGRHNMSNALAAIAVGIFLQLDFAAIQKAMLAFHGVGRRFQETGRACGVRIVDDYAHHPTELKATLQAARQTQPGRIIAVFQPHRFSRTSFLLPAFAEAFVDADLIIINRIYSAGEKPIAGISAESLVKQITVRSDQTLLYLPEQADIVNYLTSEVRDGDLVLTLGAGDIWQAGTELLQRLKTRE